jgi:predicted HTH domain antitoxin
MALLIQNLVVPLTPLSQLTFTFIYDLAPLLCGVIDAAESGLSGVIDTARSNLISVNNTAETAQTPLSQFEKLVKALRSFKEKIKSKFKQG